MWMYFRGFERLIVTFCVPLLIYIGYRLFVTGVTGEMKITAKMRMWSGSITAVAPGSLCFLLGVALGSYVMFSKVTANAPDGSVLSFLGGGEQATYPLSMRLKIALGELQICNASHVEADRDICTKAFQHSFKLVPMDKDMAQIERVEGDLKKGSATAADEHFKLRQTFEK
jgi:hypothetical protein